MGLGSKKTIIIAPLDWGLGHATRIIPLVYWLQNHYKVIVAAPKRAHFLFADYNIELITIPGYDIKYYKRLPLLLLFIQIPKYIFVAIRTQWRVQQIIKKYNPILFISDNRPFFRSHLTPSVYITHQLQIQHPSAFLKTILNRVHHSLIRKFTECWVPDTENHAFAGNLSKTEKNIPCLYIGGLSRFMLQKPEYKAQSTYQNVCILSGPEPMRSVWMKQMIERWKTDCKSIIIGVGSPKGAQRTIGNVTLSGHLPDEEFIHVLKNSKLIVTRSGYTTIMDLLWLNKTAYLAPTPKQHEQEYLAGFHHNHCFKRFLMSDNKPLTPFTPSSANYSNYLFCNSEIIIESVRKLVDKA